MRFEVSINGEVQCSAGITEGSVSVQIYSSWSSFEDFVLKNVQWNAPHSAMKGEPAIDVTGLDAMSVGERTFWVWLQEKLQLGDEVTIRILAGGPVTPPKGRKGLRSNPKRPAVSAYGVA